MPSLKRKKSFITPFSQASNISAHNIEAQTKLPRQNGEKKDLSPVHLGRNVQIITPHTRQKIKKRFALGFPHVSVRDTSPGVYVPFDLSQASCMSQSAGAQDETDQEGMEGVNVNNEPRDVHIRADQNVQHFEEEHLQDYTNQDGKDKAEIGSKIKEMHVPPHQNIQGFEEEFDLELLEEVTGIEETMRENMNETDAPEATVRNQESAVQDDAQELGEVEQGIVAKKHKKNIIVDREKSENLSTGPNNEDIVEENKAVKSVQATKSKRSKVNPKHVDLLKTKMFGKRFVKKKILKGKGQFCKSMEGSKIDFATNDISRFRKIKQKSRDKIMSDSTANIGKDAMETTDFCPLSMSYHSQNVPSRKRTSKRPFQMVKQEVLKTLYKMHYEIQELLERRKLLRTNGADLEKSESIPEHDVPVKQSKNDVVQEE